MIFFYTTFDRNGVLDRQFELQEAAAVVWDSHKLYPRCITFSPSGTLLLGCSSDVLRATPNYQNAIYAINLSTRAVTAYPRLGSLAAFTADRHLVTTLHYNGEVRLPLRVDDALAISAAPNSPLPAHHRGGEGAAPAMKLLTSLSEYCYVEFPMLDRQPGTATGRSAIAQVMSQKYGFQIFRSEIYSLLPLDAGRILCLMWDSAQNIISRAFAVIYSQEGRLLDILVEDIAPGTQMRWNNRNGDLISFAEGNLAVRDRGGKVVQIIQLNPKDRSTLKGYDLSGITAEGHLIFASTKKKGTNSFFIAHSLDEALGNEVGAHKKWLSAAKKAHSPVNFRWTTALVPG